MLIKAVEQIEQKISEVYLIIAGVGTMWRIQNYLCFALAFGAVAGYNVIKSKDNMIILAIVLLALNMGILEISAFRTFIVGSDGRLIG